MRIQTIRRTLFLFVSFTIGSSTLLAHDTWIAPERFVIKPGESITLHMTSGMDFPKLDYAIKADRIASATLRVAGRRMPLKPRGSTNSLDFEIRSPSAGVAVIGVTLRPKDIELTPAQVGEYFDEIGAGDDLRRAWAQQTEPKKWHERYTKHAKTFVRITSADRSWKQALGQRLEFVPESDPTSLRAGDTLAVRLVESGKPLANFPVGIVREWESHGTVLKSDGEGRITFNAEKGGRYLIRATHVRRAGSGSADWISDFATLTVVVE